MKTIVSVSGGLASAYALKLAIDQFGRENVVAVFADVKGTGYSHFWSEFPELEYLLHERFGGESADTYRFLWHLSHALDIDIIRLEDGRSIWAVFGQKRAFALFANKSTFCMASEWLKREMIARWAETTFEAGAYQIALGMGHFEGHRTHNARKWWARRMGYEVNVFSPAADLYTTHKKIIDDCHMMDWLNSTGLELPSAYLNGYTHNNCGGVCVLAGQTQYAMLYRDDFGRYMYAVWQEMRLQTLRGIDATILKITRDDVGRGISLFDFIALIEGDEVNLRDMGKGCSCFTALPAMTTFLAQAAVKA
jgi:hypothetical protein